MYMQKVQKQPKAVERQTFTWLHWYIFMQNLQPVMNWGGMSYSISPTNIMTHLDIPPVDVLRPPLAWKFCRLRHKRCMALWPSVAQLFESARWYHWKTCPRKAVLCHNKSESPSDSSLLQFKFKPFKQYTVHHITPTHNYMFKTV